tara:strand:+ start:5261 stop:7723 length:2463 start_codon:yes stop_codon:yes gene_type:complete
MKDTTVVTDFKDLRKAIEEVTKKNPAKTRYQQQAEKMGYTKDKTVVAEQTISEASALDGMMDIVKTKGAKKVNGVMIDMFTASVITKAYDKVNDANKKKMEKANVQTLVKLAQKVMGMKEDTDLNSTVEGFASDAQRRAAFASGYKEKGKKKDKKESVNEENLQERMKLKDVMRKHGRELKKVSKSNSLELSKKAEDDLMTWAMNSGEIRTDDPDEFDQWLDNNIDDLVKGKIKEENLQEGTWAVPDSYKKLYNLQVGFLQMPSKPTPSNAKRMAKNIYDIFGDDSFFDDLLRVEKGMDGAEEKDLRNLIVKHLEPWGLKFKKGSKYQITHAPQKWLDNMTANPAESAKKRKSGNIKKSGLGSRKKVIFKTDKKDKLVSLKVHEDEMSRAKEVIALQKKHEREKEIEKEKLEREKEKAKQAADRAKQTESFVTKSPFKLKSKQYPKAIGVTTEGYGKRHAKQENILEACESFGMITEQELQVEKIEKVLGKQGFLTYNKAELDDIFEERETQRMILALESVTEETKPTEYDRESITKALEEDLNVEFTKPDGMKAMGPVLKMSSNTYNLKDMHTGKSFTFKYIDEDKEVKTFGQVISEARFSAKLVKQAGGIAFDKRYVAGNMTGAVKAIEKLKKGLSDDPKVRELLRIANESFNTPFFKEMSSEDQNAYVKFFQKSLKKYDVTSPAQLSKDKKKQFFNYIDKNYKAKDEDVKENNIPHMCATHVEHGMWGSGLCVSGEHDIVEQEDGSFEVKHYTVEFEHGIEEMVSVNELAVVKAESHAHAMAKKAGRKKKKSEQQKIDARRKTFREKMKKLGYIKAR